jgi:hypothetical protein
MGIILRKAVCVLLSSSRSLEFSYSTLTISRAINQDEASYSDTENY